MTSLTNNQFATDLVADFASALQEALVAAGICGAPAAATVASSFTAALGPALIDLLPQWNDDGGVTRSVVLNALTGQINFTNTWQVQLANWSVGTLTGGYTDATCTTPGGPYYPFTNKFGVLVGVLCPAGYLDTISGGAVSAATAAATTAEAARDTAQGYRDAAGSHASDAQAAQTAAAASAAAAAGSQGAAATSASESATSQGAAATSAAAAAISEANAHGSEVAAASSASSADADATAAHNSQLAAQGAMGVAVSSATLLSTVAALSLLTAGLPPGLTAFRTSGANAPGDLGAADWARVNSQPAHPASWRLADHFLKDGTTVDAANGGWVEVRERMVTPELFGAVGDGIADDGPALVKLSQYINYQSSIGVPSAALFAKVYRVGRRAAPIFGTDYAKEGALTILQPQGVSIEFLKGSMILMDNLNPATGLGDQFHGILVMGPGKKVLLRRPTVEWKTMPGSAIASLTINSAGSGGTDGSYPLAFSGAYGSGAAGTFTVTGGHVTAVNLTSGGQGYSGPRSNPLVISTAACPGLTGAVIGITGGGGRSNGDGIRWMGYPDDAAVSTYGNGKIEEFRIEDSRVKWAPQAGLIMMGCSDGHITKHRSHETNADGFHINACRGVTGGTIVGWGCGDDVCALVGYYLPGPNKELYGNPGKDPFGESAYSEWSNTGCVITQVIARYGAASACRFGQGTDYAVLKVNSKYTLQAWIADAGNYDGQYYGWTTIQPLRVYVGAIDSYGDNIGIYCRSFNNDYSADCHPIVGSVATLPTSDSRLWQADVHIGSASVRAATDRSFIVQYIKGIRAGPLKADGRHFTFTAYDDCDFELVEITNRNNVSMSHSIITGITFTSNNRTVTAIPYGSTRPFTQPIIRKLKDVNTGIELQDVTGIWIGNWQSTNADKNGYYLLRTDYAVVDSGSIINCNRVNDTVQCRAIGFEAGKHNRIRTSVQHDANHLTLIEYGGASAGALTDDNRVEIEAIHGLASAPINIQGGLYTPTRCHWEGRVFNGGAATPAWQIISSRQTTVAWSAPPSIAGNFGTTTVGGSLAAADLNDQVIVTYSADVGSLDFKAWVDAAGHFTIRITNPTAAAITPAAGTWTARLFKN